MPPPHLADRSVARHFVGILRAIPAIVFLPVSLVTINLIQLFSLLLRPFSLRAFRGVNRWLANRWWGWCVIFSKKLSGVAVEVTGDEVPRGENAIVVANHQSMADVVLLMFLARQKGRLGDLKWFVKQAMKFVPGVGWGMAFLDCLFVKRRWSADRDSIQRTFAKITRDRVPVWFVTFPEGTRITAAKHESSRAFAEQRGLDVPTHTLVPRTKGFVASVIGLRQHIDAVYDVTIGFPVGVPSIWQYIIGLMPRAELYVQRHAIREMPQSQEDLTAWLHERFVNKDARLERYYQSGSFA